MKQKSKYKSLNHFLNQLNDYDRHWLRTTLILLFSAFFLLGLVIGLMFLFY